MQSTTTAGSIAPTVSITTFYDDDHEVDTILNSPFTPASISNTNRVTFTSLTIEDPQIIERQISKGYFGHLLFTFKPRTSTAVSSGYYFKFIFTSEFYPFSNQLNLPLICLINGVRQTCTYTLSPFTVTFPNAANKFTTSLNSINITTEYLDHNGIYHPAAQGRYLLEYSVYNVYNNVTYEGVQQYVDILPGTLPSFNVNYAHRDIGRSNIFEIEFRNGGQTIPAYNDGTTAGRIYIGFPVKDENNGNVFASDLGFSSGLGTVVPCWFKSGVGYVTPLSGKNLTCHLRNSPYSPKYAYIEVVNFDSIPADTNMKVIVAKITNPGSKNYDINFILKINTMKASTREEFGLYENYYNMFFNMLSASITSRNEVDTSTVMFEPGTRVGDYGKYINSVPYTVGGFATDDWYIVDLNSEFQLNGLVSGCLSVYYQYCIVFREINWFAVKIGNTTILPLQVYVDRMPVSISRVDTSYTAFTFKSERWSETITYTITAAYRWMELRGAITGFGFNVLGSQDKLNINQKDVDVMVSFTTSHIIYRGGTIEIQFPNNSTFVPSIKPHCRSAVTMGSQLMGDPSGKPPINVQGDVGCLIQNSYSWVITSFDELPAGSQIKIWGKMDLPTQMTASLGMGYVVTYSNTHSSNVFSNGRIIDYLTTNFPLEVNNKTWNLD